MLYDPKWDAPIKTNPLSLEALIAWLEGQPAERAYCYMSSSRCVAAQYNASIGRKYNVVVLGDRPAAPDFDYLLEDIACGEGFEDRTFGAALVRARAELARR